MDIQKEFEKWSNSKVIAFGEELTWRNGQPTYEECWNAGATLMANRVRELEEVINQRDNEIKTIRAISNGMLKENEKLKTNLQAESIKWTHTAQYKLSQHLQSKLDEAVSIIKIIKENVIHYAVTEEEQHLAYKIEQFLSSLDKIKEE